MSNQNPADLPKIPQRIPLRSAETLRRILAGFSLDLHTAIPGIVRSYDASTQTADVQPAVRRVIPARDEDDDPDAVESLPVLPAVPVAWPRAGGFFLHWPLAEGDSVLVVFSEADLNAWRASGAESDPGVATRHGLSGAVALPGLYPRGNPLGDASDTYGRVGREGGPFVEFHPDAIHVGGLYDLTKATELDAHLGAIQADLETIATAAGTSATYNRDTLSALGADYHTSITKGE